MNTINPARSTKQEIFKAYTELLEKTKASKTVDPASTKNEIETKRIVEKSSTLTPDKIIADLGTSKLSIINAVELLSNQLIGKSNELAEINRAISQQQRELENISQFEGVVYDIEVLLQSKNELESDYQERLLKIEAELKDKKEASQKEWREFRESLEKSNERYREECKYKLSIDERKMKDEMNDSISELKKELAEIESKIEYYKALEKQIETFNAFKADEIANALETQAKQLTRDFDHKNELSVSKFTAETNLLRQEIGSLKTINSSLMNEIIELKELNKALTQQGQAIATKAIEGASKSAQNIIVKSDSKN